MSVKHNETFEDLLHIFHTRTLIGLQMMEFKILGELFFEISSYVPFLFIYSFIYRGNRHLY